MVCFREVKNIDLKKNLDEICKTLVDLRTNDKEYGSIDHTARDVAIDFYDTLMNSYLDYFEG